MFNLLLFFVNDYLEGLEMFLSAWVERLASGWLDHGLYFGHRALREILEGLDNFRILLRGGP